jgi:predicted nucleotidyltransferase
MDLDALRAAVDAEPAVVAAWLFGSRARGTARPTSDVDVAVLLGNIPERAELGWDIEARLCAAVRLPVQVVVADTAPADLVRRILRDGIVLVDRDPAARVRYEVRKRMEYFDMTPIWRMIRRLPPGVAP